MLNLVVQVSGAVVGRSTGASEGENRGGGGGAREHQTGQVRGCQSSGLKWLLLVEAGGTSSASTRLTTSITLL